MNPLKQAPYHDDATGIAQVLGKAAAFRIGKIRHDGTCGGEHVAAKNFSERSPAESLGSAPNLLVDENLIGLARWLRFFGIDTSMAVGWKDSEVAAFARKKRRLLITRDRHLARSMKPDPVIQVETDETREQLKAVLREVGVPREGAWFSRCVKCNRILRESSYEEAAADPEAPRFAGREAEPFWHCDHCHRTYWRGSHFDRTRDYLLNIAHEVREGQASG